MPSDAGFDTFHSVNERGERTTSSFSSYDWLIPLSTILIAFAVPYIFRLATTSRTLRTYISRAIVHGKIMTRFLSPRPVYNPWGLPSRRYTYHGSPTGLENVDFSCYQNSIIQGLASLESMPSFLHRVQTDESESTAF